MTATVDVEASTAGAASASTGVQRLLQLKVVTHANGGSVSVLCSGMLLSTHRNLQASWESVGTEGHESSLGERAARLQVISTLAQTALTDEHSDAVAAVADSMARTIGQVLGGAYMWARRPPYMQWQR